MRICKGRCKLYGVQPRNYNDGRKSCRLCEFFIKTSATYCPCCSYPLAYKGRANQTQLARRELKKASHAEKQILPIRRGDHIMTHQQLLDVLTIQVSQK